MVAASEPRKRVAIIGAGAAGMAAAYSLSRNKDEFDVTVIEAGRVPGGVACTFSLPDGTPVNYGVQGGSPAAHQNTIELMRQFGIDVGDTRLDVSFGVGEHNWKNYEASELQAQLRPEIAAFGRVLWWVSKLEFITIFVSIDFLLRVLRFSAAFRFRMVYPLVALFFGTGNQTPKVSAAVIARVFLDQNLAIFEYDAQRLLAQTPTNIAFDDLQGFYGKMRAAIESAHCRFRFGTRVTRIERPGNSNNNKNGPVRVHVAKADAVWRGGSDQLDGQYPIAGGGPRCQPEHAEAEKKRAAASDLLYTADEMEEVIEVDELILATPANVSLSLLGESASYFEKSVLSSVEYYHDLTVTHTDAEYMRSHNEVDGKAIYFIRTHPEAPECLEMGFELSQYQPRLREYKQSGAEPIYQTIYLDKERSSLWSIDKLNPSKVLDRAWWSAFSHTYNHFRNVVPWVWTMQGHKNTWYAGSWVLFNTHDIAIASGFAAAERLGAKYPFGHNKLAAATYDTVLGAAHLRVRGWLRWFS